MYDIVAGRQVLKPSYVLSKSKALELFPMLKKDKLVGALVYYDGKLVFLCALYFNFHKPFVQSRCPESVCVCVCVCLCVSA